MENHESLGVFESASASETETEKVSIFGSSNHNILMSRILNGTLFLITGLSVHVYEQGMYIDVNRIRTYIQSKSYITIYIPLLDTTVVLLKGLLNKKDDYIDISYFNSVYRQYVNGTMTTSFYALDDNTLLYYVDEDNILFERLQEFYLNLNANTTRLDRNQFMNRDHTEKFRNMFLVDV